MNYFGFWSSFYQLLEANLMRIHADPDPDTDPDPKHCRYHRWCKYVDLLSGVFIFVQSYIYSPSRGTPFFNLYRALFALILLHFALIYSFTSYFHFLFLLFTFLFAFLFFVLHFPPCSLLFVFFPPNDIGWYFPPPGGGYFPIFYPPCFGICFSGFRFLCHSIVLGSELWDRGIILII